MVKLISKNDHVALEANITVDAYNKVKRFAPNALNVKDEDGEVTFAVSLCEKGTGSISNYGVTFNAHTREGNLSYDYCRRGLSDIEVEKAKKILAEDHLNILVNIKTIEQQVAEALNNVTANVEEAMQAVEVE